MANSSIEITQGTQTPVAGDSVNGTQYQTIKLDIGASGVSTPFIGSIPNIGTLSTTGTIPGIGSLTNLGSVSNLGSVTNIGSIAGIGGTVLIQGASVGTYNNIATGTVNAVGSVSTIGSIIGIGGTVNVNGATVGTTNQIAGGTIVSGSPDANNPVKVGGVFNGTPPSFSSGARGDLQLDVNGNTKVTLATLIAGEDLTNNFLVVEPRASYSSFVGTSGSVQIKSSPGRIKGIFVNAVQGSPASLVVYDNTVASGQQLIGTFQVQPSTMYNFGVGAAALTAIYVGITGTAGFTVFWS